MSEQFLLEILENYKKNFRALSIIENQQIYTKALLDVFEQRDKAGLNLSDLTVSDLQELFDNEVLPIQKSSEILAHYLSYQFIMTGINDEDFSNNYPKYLHKINASSQQEDELYKVALDNLNPFIYKVHVFQLVKAMNKLIQMKNYQIASNPNTLQYERYLILNMTRTLESLNLVYEKLPASEQFTSTLRVYLAKSLQSYFASCFQDEQFYYFTSKLVDKFITDYESSRPDAFTDNTIIRTTCFFADMTKDNLLSSLGIDESSFASCKRSAC